MNIKNLKYYSTSLLLATSIALSGSGCSDRFVDDETVIGTTIDNETRLESGSIIEQGNNQNLNADEISNIIRDINLYFNSSVSLYYYHNSGMIMIYGAWENTATPELSDELYEKLNLLLQQPSVETLEIYHLGDEIDFSRVNLSSINNIKLSGCQIKFNYDSLQNHEYEHITFESIPAEQATKILENSCTTNTAVDYINFNNSTEVSNFIKFLADKEIFIDHLYIATTECNQEDQTTLSQINATNIEIMFSLPSKEIYNLEFYPNKNTKSLKIWHTGAHIELGNIQVITDCPEFKFGFNGYQSSITENTHFSLPNDSSVFISAIYENGDSLKELSNVSKLSYYNFAENKEIYYYEKYNDFDEVINKFLHDNQYQYQKGTTIKETAEKVYKDYCKLYQ